MADLNSTLGHPQQQTLIAIADVSALLGGSRKTAWDASTDTTAKENAVMAASILVNDLTFSGWRLFDYPQPFALPRSCLCSFDTLSGQDGSSTVYVVNSSLETCNRTEWVGGAVHLANVTDNDYGKAAKITAYSRSAGRFTVAGDNVESFSGKSITVVSPLPIDVRQALAIQAHELMLKEEHHEFANSMHKGKTSEWGERGVSGQWVGPRSLWHVEAYMLLKKYIAKHVSTGRN